jgi:hypothetical protein
MNSTGFWCACDCVAREAGRNSTLPNEDKEVLPQLQVSSAEEANKARAATIIGEENFEIEITNRDDTRGVFFAGVE